MRNKFKIKIVTPEKVVHEGEATRFTTTTESGEITVLAKHTPLVSLLVPGEMTVECENEYVEWYAVSGGIVEVRPDGEVVVLADTSEHGSQIDIEEARLARERAEKAMAEEDGEKVSARKFQEVINYEMARIKVRKQYIKKIESIS